MTDYYVLSLKYKSMHVLLFNWQFVQLMDPDLHYEVGSYFAVTFGVVLCRDSKRSVVKYYICGETERRNLMHRNNE